MAQKPSEEILSDNLSGQSPNYVEPIGSEITVAFNYSISEKVFIP